MTRPTHQAQRDPVPALVIGQGVTVLGTLRSLGEAGIPSYTAGASGDYSRWSRWYRRLPGPSLRTDTPDALTEDLARSSVDEAVLIPCSDSAAVAVASLPAALQSRFHASCSTAEVQAILADKLRFARILQRLEIPHPETIEIDSRATIETMSDDDLARFFLKPLDSETFSRRYGIKACLLRGKEHALHKHDWLDGEGQAVVLQEYIPGPPSRHYFVDGFVDRHGRTRARFARQRIRMYPASLGNSSCMISVSLDEVAGACASLDRLLADLDYRGIFSAEFKRDPRDEVYKLIEVNARPWWYIGFAHDCGINVAAMAHADALGHDVPDAVDYPVGRWCVNPRNDVKAAFSDWREGKLDRGQCLTAWLRGSRPLFAWSDPGPMACEVVRLVPRTFKKLVAGRRR